MPTKINFRLSLPVAIITAFLVAIPNTAQTLTLTFSQNPDPFQALEGTTGNIGFLNVTNTDTSSATITSIHVGTVLHTGGEFDDQATNVVIIGPNPSGDNPLVLAPGGNFNIKFSWDAVDNIKDNDVDFGLWQANFLLQGAVSLEVAFVHADLRVNDTPLHAALPLFATGFGALGLLGWRKKRKRSRQFVTV